MSLLANVSHSVWECVRTSGAGGRVLSGRTCEPPPCPNGAGVGKTSTIPLIIIPINATPIAVVFVYINSFSPDRAREDNDSTT